VIQAFSNATGANRVKVVSFSGIDGAGKSTQIEALHAHLLGLGCRIVSRTFWDDVVAFPYVREFISHRAFKGDKGIGSPEKPISRRDKNVQSWYVTAARLIFYLFDALSLRMTLATISERDADVVIFDRYIYDELANLPLQHAVMQLYVRMILRLSPRPDVAYLIDADPEAARIRKPEYPLEFLRRNRDAYIALSQLSGMSVVAPLSIEETKSKIVKLFSAKCMRKQPEESPPMPASQPHAPTSNL
jgi:thymidylate kinase